MRPSSATGKMSVAVIVPLIVPEARQGCGSDLEHGHRERGVRNSLLPSLRRRGPCITNITNATIITCPLLFGLLFCAPLRLAYGRVGGAS